MKKITSILAGLVLATLCVFAAPQAVNTTNGVANGLTLKGVTTNNSAITGGSFSGSVNSNQVLNVLDFGVDNTGTVTNTTTIGKAMIAATDGRKRTLQFPAGIYKISSPLYITNDNVSLEALGLVILVQTTDGADTICITNFQAAAYNYQTIWGDKFVIDPGYYSGTTNSGIGLRVYGVGGGSVDNASFDNMQIRHCAIGVKYQEVSNTRFFGSINSCGIGFESTNSGNGNFLNVDITSCYQGMVIHSGRGWTIVARDFGAPNMTNAIVFDNASYGTLIGGNFEMYGGDIAPFKTTGGGGSVWTFEGVNLPSGFIPVQSDYSFAFQDSGANASSFNFINCFFQHNTNVGGAYQQIFLGHVAVQKVYSWPVPMTAAIYDMPSGTLLSTNAWVGKDRMSYTTLTVSAGDSYWDFATLPPRWMVAVPTNTAGTLDQVNLLQYSKDFPTGRTGVGNASTNAVQNFIANQTFNNGVVLRFDENSGISGITHRDSSGIYTSIAEGIGWFTGNEYGLYYSASAGGDPFASTAIPFYYIDTANNRTTIGWTGTRAGSAPNGTATLNVNGTLTATGVISGNGAGLTNNSSSSIVGGISSPFPTNHIAPFLFQLGTKWGTTNLFIQCVITNQ